MPSANPQRPYQDVYQIAGVLYLAGFCVLALKLLAGTLLSRRLTHEGTSAEGLIAYSTRCIVPITVGLFGARIYLPVDSKDWDPAKLDAVLIHEKEHVRRRDPLIEWLALLNRSLYWFNPLSWWLCSKLSGLAEQTCDETVLARGYDSSTYAEYLLDFARSVKRKGALITVRGSSLHGSRLNQRIRRILTSGRSPSISPVRLSVVMLLCAISILIPSICNLARAQATLLPAPVALAESNMASQYREGGGNKLNPLYSTAAAPTHHSSSDSDRTLYERGKQLLNTANYGQARLAFQTLVNRYPDSRLAADALLSVGDSFFQEGGSENLRQAEEQYKLFAALFPANPKIADAQMKLIALNHRLLRDAKYTFKADQGAQDFLRQFPDSDYAPIVQQYLKDLETVPGYYRKWLDEDVVYIITPEERSTFLALKDDTNRDSFIEHFWARRNPDPTSAENSLKEEHYRRIAYANLHYTSSEPGWRTDQGRIYIMFGKPDKVESHPGGTNGMYPYEDWYYRNIKGVGDDIQIEFVDQSGTGKYKMAMSPDEKEALPKP